MAFSNFFFLFFFLPVFLIIYLILDKVKGADNKLKNIVLILFSLIFYLFLGLRALLILLGLTVITFLLVWLMEKSEGKKRKVIFILSIAVLTGSLSFFKYAGFFSNIIMPAGISFYIFKLISVSADVYLKRIDEKISFSEFMLYAVCFHNIMQGPIVRYGDISYELKNRKFSHETFKEGVIRFSSGLFKKTVFSDHLGSLSDILIPLSGGIEGVPVLSVWAGSILFSLQMYLDFSAYSDMAIGLGKMCGFNYKENFDYPYMSGSVKEFWRKWHISLSFFFRDYVYIPLGGNRKGEGRRILNLLIVWLLTGIWHGQTINFIIWGLYYFIFLLLEDLIRKLIKKEIPAVFRFLSHIYVIFVFNLGWLIFRFTDTSDLISALRIFFLRTDNPFDMASVDLTLKNNIFFIIASVLLSTPVFKKLYHMIEKRFEEKGRIFALNILQAVFFITLILISSFFMAGNSFTPFLYNKF